MCVRGKKRTISTLPGKSEADPIIGKPADNKDTQSQ